MNNRIEELNTLIIEELKTLILEANDKYRAGEDSGLSDEAYDALVKEFEGLVDKDTYDTFRDSLNEGEVENDLGDAKVKHPYMMGSLDKITCKDGNKIKTLVGKNLILMKKVDGISCRLTFEDGKLVMAATRGNGSEGRDITKLVSLIKVPTTISYLKPITIRGELVMFSKDFELIKDKFSNPRNTVAGVFNHKVTTKEDLEVLMLVSFLTYEVSGPELNKAEQLKLLEDLGFDVTFNHVEKFATVDDFITECTTIATTDMGYPTDGVVIAEPGWHNEIDRYRPRNSIAFKVAGNLTGESIFRGIEWEGPSFTGKLNPVAIFDPIPLGGAIVQRATLHNITYIKKLGLKVGCKILIEKRNDIIPRVEKVIS